MIEHLIVYVPILLTIVAVIALFAMGYVSAKPNEAIVITGLRKPRTLIGRAGFMIPFIEKRSYISIEQFSIDVRTTDSVPTLDFINVNADAVVKVRVGSTEALLDAAAQNFLNWKTSEIASSIQDVLEGNLREIIGQMNLRDMVNNRQEFAEKVQLNASPDLAKMGLEIIAFTVQTFTDNAGVIENLGIDHIVSIKKDAANSRARAEREQAEVRAQEEQAANEARVAADLEIAQKQNELDKIKSALQAEADTERAKADAAYEIQKEIQRKEIERLTAEANIVRQEKEAEIKEREVKVREQSLAADIKATADADRYAREQAAEAERAERQSKAEAELFETEKESQARKAKAEADRFAAEEEAKGIEARGRAEAEAIRLKLEAEAEGLSKKADALAKMDKAGIAQMYFDILPQVVASAAGPLSKVGNITMYGDGNSSKLVGDIMQTIDQVNSGSGLDVREMLAGLVGANVTGSAIGRQIANAQTTED